MLRNPNNNSFAVQYKLFSIVGSTRKGETMYYYYVRFFFDERLGGRKIYQSKRKSKYLNKYTLSLIGFIVNVFHYPLKGLLFILMPFIMYVNGLLELISDGNFYSEVKVFSWVNFITVIGLIIWLIFK